MPRRARRRHCATLPESTLWRPYCGDRWRRRSGRRSWRLRRRCGDRHARAPARRATSQPNGRGDASGRRTTEGGCSGGRRRRDRRHRIGPQRRRLATGRPWQRSALADSDSPASGCSLCRIRILPRLRPGLAAWPVARAWPGSLLADSPWPIARSCGTSSVPGVVSGRLRFGSPRSACLACSASAWPIVCGHRDRARRRPEAGALSADIDS